MDASWPKPLPNGWIIGQVSGIATDAQDHVWVLQRPRSLTDDERGASFTPPLSACCRAAPPVLEFDAEGNLLQSWGGPGAGFDWPENEHGIFVDDTGYVWITGAGANDGQVLKFTRDGAFVLQIGTVGPQTGSGDVTRLGQPAAVTVDTSAGEVYVADGYFNRRVIVFDARTGAYRRHWGAFGKPPEADVKPNLRRTAPPTAAQLEQFGNPVHCVRLARDGLLYVCDRLNNRVQVFRKDGTFVKQFFVAPSTAGNGSVWDIVLSRDQEQRWLFMADGRNNQILTLLRETGEVLGSLGRPGRYAGEFHWCMTSPSIRRETSTRVRSIPASACRSSSCSRDGGWRRGAPVEAKALCTLAWCCASGQYLCAAFLLPCCRVCFGSSIGSRRIGTVAQGRQNARWNAG